MIFFHRVSDVLFLFGFHPGCRVTVVLRLTVVVAQRSEVMTQRMLLVQKKKPNVCYRQSMTRREMCMFSS